MSPSNVIESFIKDFVQELHNDSAAIFAGAGLSKGCGYVDWPELLRDIANELGLNVDKEHDLISLAQFHVNTRRTSDGLAKKILQEFSEQAEPSEVHDILARLPIHSFWTTNYDSLIEDALRNSFRVPDVIDALTKTHKVLTTSLEIPVRAYARVIAAQTHLDQWIAVPLLILERRDN